MKKLTILLGVLALAFVPASVASAEYTSDDAAPVTTQTVDEDTDFTVNVLAAIELSDPADDNDSVAPVAGGASDVTADLDMAASLRSNLRWNIASSTAGKLSGGQNGPTDLLSDLTGDSASVDSDVRNTSNAAQGVSADYDQNVSWGDEAGAYTETITHVATQSLSA